jgi:phenylalanine-4-hydroxylase
MYDEEDHKTWSILFKRQNKLHERFICREYLNGFRELQFDMANIVSIDEISERLKAINGWTLVPVTGLIPTKDFFYLLINKRYPITISIRKPWEIEFSELPDIFHDVCGHLPLLTNEKFEKFLTSYSNLALKYISDERAIEALGRLYWYTYEMGLIWQDGYYKSYGGAIITSSGETANLTNPDIPKYQFDIGHIFRTPYNPYKLQNEYFAIASFDDLFNCLGDMETKLVEYLLMPQDMVVENVENASI